MRYNKYVSEEKTGCLFSCNDNVPVSLIFNTHTDVPHASAKRWDHGTKATLKLY